MEETVALQPVELSLQPWVLKPTKSERDENAAAKRFVLDPMGLTEVEITFVQSVVRYVRLSTPKIHPSC